MRQFVRNFLRGDQRPLVMVARNVSSRYIAILVETIVGLVMLPFNIAHLGPSAYGLWMLTASVTIHFSVLDLGYGGSLVKFVAQYRARRNTRALNEIASTLFFVFAAVGCLAYLVAIGVAFNLDAVFRLTPEQAQIGKWLLLIIGVHVALNFPFSIYGGIVSGFQRYDINSLVAIVVATVVALVNVSVLLAGYGLVTLVAATTSVRVLGYLVYRANARRIFPELHLTPRLFRRARLREVTGFSVYSSIIDWANKLNYQIDQVVIGIFLGAAPVAVWAVAVRIISATQRLTNQLNGVLFPMIVDSHATLKQQRLQQILLEGTRLSLTMVMTIVIGLLLLAEPLVRAWVGRPELMGSALLIQILAIAVVFRVGGATSTTLLKGSDRHRMLAGVNLATALVNVGLSIVLIRRFGLPGVAVGTLVPLGVTAMFVTFPAACRRVDLPIGRALQHSVIPALWPATVVLVAGSMLLPRLESPTLLHVGAQALAAALLYLAIVFGVAIGRRDRAAYLTRLSELTGAARSANTGGETKSAPDLTTREDTAGESRQPALRT